MGDQLAASRAAAPIRFGQFDQINAVDQLHQRARLLPHLLGATQVTGIMVGDARFDPSGRFFQRNGHQKLANVADFGAESDCTFGPFRFVSQHLPVFLEFRAAGGAIRDDHIGLSRFEQCDVETRVRFRQVHAPIPGNRHAAANCVLWCDHRTAVAG